MTAAADCKIYEFSTGIVPDTAEDGSWFSRRFTGGYMNNTFPGGKIPDTVERAIRNKHFSVVEGGKMGKPAIIGRVIPGNPDYSVVALVSRGKDEVGRPLTVHRYFITEGQYNLPKILDWLKDYRSRYKKLPIFHPEAPRRAEGDIIPHFQSWNMTVNDAEKRVLEKDIPVLTQGNQYDFDLVHILAANKAQDQPLSWAYNAVALENPWSFTLIHAEDNEAYKKIKVAIENPPEQVADSEIDPQRLEAAVKGLSTSSRVRKEWVQVVAEAVGNEAVTEKYWRQVFNGEGADRSKDIPSPPMARLLTLRAMILPESLPYFLRWPHFQQHKEVSLEFQHEFYNLILDPSQPPRGVPDRAERSIFQDRLAQGVSCVLQEVLLGKCTLETVVELLTEERERSVWNHCVQGLVENIADDFKSIVSFKPSGSSEEPQLKCDSALWEPLLHSNYPFKSTDRKKVKKHSLRYYLPLAELFDKLEKDTRGAYFYQISTGMVPSKIFISVYKKEKGFRRNGWKMRWEINENDYQLESGSITLHKKRDWIDRGIMGIRMLVSTAKFIWECFVAIIKGIGWRLNWLLNNLVKPLCQWIFKHYKQIGMSLAVLTAVGLIIALGWSVLAPKPWEQGIKPENLATTRNQIELTAANIVTKAGLESEDKSKVYEVINNALCLGETATIPCDVKLILESKSNEQKQKKALIQQVKLIIAYQEERKIAVKGVIGKDTQAQLEEDALASYRKVIDPELLPKELETAKEKFDDTKKVLAGIVSGTVTEINTKYNQVPKEDIKLRTISALKAALGLDQKTTQYGSVIEGNEGKEEEKETWIERVNHFQLTLEETWSGDWGIIASETEKTATELKTRVKTKVEKELKKELKETGATLKKDK